MVHHFRAPRSYAGDFIGIAEIKYELSSRNAQIGIKLSIFLPMRPWNLMDDLEIQ